MDFFGLNQGLNSEYDPNKQGLTITADTTDVEGDADYNPTQREDDSEYAGILRLHPERAYRSSDSKEGSRPSYQDGAKLVTTLLHEGVHREQHLRGNFSGSFKEGEIEPQEASNEVQAYDAELELAKALGTSKGDVKDAQNRRAEYLENSGSYKESLKKKDYELPKGLVIKGAQRSLR